jgi:hypothetical protein
MNDEKEGGEDINYCEECNKSMCTDCKIRNSQQTTLCWKCSVKTFYFSPDIAKYFIMKDSRFGYNKDLILQELGTDKGNALIK